MFYQEQQNAPYMVREIQFPSGHPIFFQHISEISLVEFFNTVYVAKQAFVEQYSRFLGGNIDTEVEVFIFCFQDMNVKILLLEIKVFNALNAL